MAGNTDAKVGVRIYEGRTHGKNLLSGDNGKRVITMIISWLVEQQPTVDDAE